GPEKACLTPISPFGYDRGMSDEKIYPVPEDWAKRAWIDQARYEALYRQSIDDPEGFWREQAQRIDWIEPFTENEDVSYDPKDLHIRECADGALNACANCRDGYLTARANQAAIIWEGDDASEDRKITYGELQDEVCRFANVLRELGVNRGDRVTVDMPMIP